MSYPTAWMSRHDNHIVTFDRLLVAEAENAGVDNWIPLYTTPQTKPSPDGCIDPKSYFAGYEDGKLQQINTPCEHEIVDARNKFVESGYMCVKCMSLFKGQHTTPQTKPLSDEEIKKLHEQTSWFGISDPVKFARAIEERHGIK